MSTHPSPASLKAWLFTLLLLAATLASSWSGFDLWLTGQFYDAQRGGFYLRDSFLLAEVLHDWLKKSVVLIWVCLVLQAIRLSLRSTNQPNRHKPMDQLPFLDRRWLIWIVTASALCALTVSILKNQSAHSCPWYLAEYGGTAFYFELWGTTQAGPGRCFPSGHASVGWMWLACLIAPAGWVQTKLAQHPQKMRLLWGAVLLTGLTSSGVQIARGAHFASHVLATVLVCTVVCLILRAIWPTVAKRFSREPR